MWGREGVGTHLRYVEGEGVGTHLRYVGEGGGRYTSWVCGGGRG